MDWAKENNFGGVEIIWVYPLYRYQRWYAKDYNRHYPKDTTAQKWLSPEWQEMVTYTKSYADSIGLSCDFGFGSAWPVAGSNIDKEHSTQIYGDTSFRQWLTFAWTWPETQLVINHLDSNAFYLFAEPVGDALQEALKGSKSALFTDSWEIKLNATNKIWTPGFENTFQKTFGYDIIPYMEAGLDSFPDVRYDYMLQLDEYVTKGFINRLVKKCKELGAWSRVQCLAAPTDVHDYLCSCGYPGDGIYAEQSALRAHREFFGLSGFQKNGFQRDIYMHVWISRHLSAPGTNR